MHYVLKQVKQALTFLAISSGVAVTTKGSAITTSTTRAEWLRVGTTTSQCSYFAALEFLNEFPVGRLLIKPSSGNLVHSSGIATVIPLARLDYSLPPSYHQIPQPEDLPSYQVVRCESCGAQGTWRIIRYLSGTFEECLVIDSTDKR